MTWDPEFEVAFNPKTIALVGASTKADAFGGGSFIVSLQELGFEGRIYPVNPKGAGMEIRGLKVYPDLASVPEPVDLVIVTVPAAAAPAVLEDCVRTNNRNVHVFTAGFEETGEKVGIELGRRVREIAERGGLRIVGPNCMGIFVPKAKLGTFSALPRESGSVAFVSQSGGHYNEFSHSAAEYGIRFSKVISFGNGYTMESTDYLEYLATDPDTEIITMYLEGVGDGRRLIKLVREINPTKPVIIWKGGLTESGARAVSSHTGSMGGEEEVWGAFFQQTGAVRADSVEEIMDLAMTFLYLAPPAGRRIGVICGGGGRSVSSADVFSREGLEVPALSQETVDELKGLIPLEGNSIQNPIDTFLVLYDMNLLAKMTELVSTDPSVDILIANPPFILMRGVPPGTTVGDDLYLPFAQKLGSLAKSGTNGKPLAVVSQHWKGEPSRMAAVARFEAEVLGMGVPVYRSLERASRALSKFLGYHDFQVRVRSSSS